MQFVIYIYLVFHAMFTNLRLTNLEYFFNLYNNYHVSILFPFCNYLRRSTTSPKQCRNFIRYFDSLGISQIV